MRSGLVLWTLIGLLAAAALAWNGLRFVGTKAQPRTKDLDFLPPPLVARVLACGQPTALAKLRWIDSFSYFQLQLDRRDDAVAGTDRRGGVERLYDTLLALDPYFMPFYEHAVLNTSGLLKQYQASLSLLMRGQLALPHDTTLWRLASAELAVNFNWSKRDPAKLDRWLNAWVAAELDDAGRQLVLDWRRGLAFANVEGLQTLQYWIDHLRATKPGTPMAEFVEGTVRELLAEHGARELTPLAGLDAPAADALSRLLAEPLLPRSGITLRIEAVRKRYPRGAPAWAPLRWDGSHLELRSDPFGYPWRRDGAKVVSQGREQRRFLHVMHGLRIQLEAEAQRRGRPPGDLVEAAEWGFTLSQPPYGGRWSFEQRMPDVVWPEPPDQPWPLR